MSVHKKERAQLLDGALVWPYSSPDFVIRAGNRFVRLDIPDADELSEIVALQEKEIGRTASLQVTQAVFDANPDSFRVFRGITPCGTQTYIAGFASFLFLNDEGVCELEAGTFIGRDPTLTSLSDPNVPPAATYAWALVARGFGALAVKHAALSYRPDLYRGVPVWCTAASDAGAQLINAEGFASKRNGAGVGGVFRTDQPAVLKERAS